MQRPRPDSGRSLWGNSWGLDNSLKCRRKKSYALSLPYVLVVEMNLDGGIANLWDQQAHQPPWVRHSVAS